MWAATTSCLTNNPAIYGTHKRLLYTLAMASAASSSVSTISGNTIQLNFDNKALRVLPLDSETGNVVRQVPNACFSRVKPSSVVQPRLVALAREVLILLDLPSVEGAEEGIQKLPHLAEYLSGNRLLPGSDPAAHCYCGHQFGSFAGQLGDGATMYLGEVVNKKGERWEIQFKGAGKTPYSRSADGRKVLRSSIREFLCSEAIHHLGIPTTRALSCVTSDTRVERDIFYSGNVIKERASIVMRVAPSFIRFGSFEIAKPTDGYTGRAGPSVGNKEIIGKLVDYVIDTFYPELLKTHPRDAKARYLAFYREVVRRTAVLVAGWQSVGFCHGVLNTDNMSILGLTIDYGPYGFLDRYDPDFICNASDNQGRYTYAEQPKICKWNCGKLAEALAGQGAGRLTLEEMQKVLEETYWPLFKTEYLGRMRTRLGLSTPLDDDKQLIDDLLETMRQSGADFSLTFVLLARSRTPLSAGGQTDAKLLEDIANVCSSIADIRKTAKASGLSEFERRLIMMMTGGNPAALAQLGIPGLGGEEEDEFGTMTEDEKRARDRDLWTAWLGKYRSRLSSEVSTGSSSLPDTNPRVVLRNYLAESAIKEAEAGNYAVVETLLDRLRFPYMDDEEWAQRRKMVKEKQNAISCQSLNTWEGIPPDWAVDIKVT